MYISYFKSGKKHYAVIHSTPSVSDKVREFQIAGKREAVKIAKEQSLKPWNF